MPISSQNLSYCRFLVGCYHYGSIFQAFCRDLHADVAFFFIRLNDGNSPSPECIWGERTEAFHIIVSRISACNDCSFTATFNLNRQGSIGNHISVLIHQLNLDEGKIVLASLYLAAIGSQANGSRFAGSLQYKFLFAF